MEETLTPEVAASLLQAVAEGDGIEDTVSIRTLLALSEMALDLEQLPLCERWLSQAIVVQWKKIHLRKRLGHYS